MSALLEAENSLQKVVPVAPARSMHQGMAIVCCCAAIGSLVPVAMLQSGKIHDLPDLPGRLFNTRKVVLSKSAFPLGIPDAVLGIGSYTVTLLLLATAKPDRPVLRAALRGKLLLDGAMAARNTRKQMRKFGRICTWCSGTALATAGVVYFARKAREAEQRCYS
ncbi:MAG TPA: vitamin K epoxide reductase family protein [Acidobacteriaceae bacterium]|nr:vitamin K epoxide reductase family protein [Acidobacteriaceae bacterium]